MRFLLTFLTVFGVGLSTFSAQAAPTGPVNRIAVIDLKRCLLESEHGKAEAKKLEAAFNRNQSKLETETKDLEKRIKDLQAKAAMLSEKELKKRQQDLMRAQGELEQLGAQLQEDLANQEATLTEEIYRTASEILKQISLEERLQLVLIRSDMNVLYTNPKLDLTNRVIVAYDKKHASKK